MRLPALPFALALALPAAALAETHTHRQHDAHQHGRAQLDLVQDGASLYLMLDTPAANLLGFEHAPKTDAQKQQLDTLVDQLQLGERLFSINPEAGCQVIQASLNSALLKNGHSEHDSHPHGGGHAEFEVTYEYHCQQPELIEQLSTTLFESFPHTEQLDVQWINAHGQHATTLTPQHTKLNF